MLRAEPFFGLHLYSWSGALPSCKGWVRPGACDMYLNTLSSPVFHANYAKASATRKPVSKVGGTNFSPRIRSPIA